MKQLKTCSRLSVMKLGLPKFCRPDRFKPGLRDKAGNRMETEGTCFVTGSKPNRKNPHQSVHFHHEMVKIAHLLQKTKRFFPFLDRIVLEIDGH